MDKLDQQLKDKDYSGFLKEMEKCAKALEFMDPALKNMVKSIFAEDENKENKPLQDSKMASRSIQKNKKLSEPNSAPSFKSERYSSTRSLFNDISAQESAPKPSEPSSKLISRRISSVQEVDFSDEEGIVAEDEQRSKHSIVSEQTKRFGLSSVPSKPLLEYSVGYIAKYNSVKDLRQLNDSRLAIVPVDSFQAAWGKITHLLLAKESSFGNTAILYAIANNIPLLSLEWISACTKAKSLVDIKGHLFGWTPNKKLFERTGIMICTTAKPPKLTEASRAFAEKEREIMERVTTMMGGTPKQSYHEASILVVQDHLVDWVRSQKAKSEIGTSYHTLKIVHKSWLVASVMENFVKNPDNPKYNLINQLIKE